MENKDKPTIELEDVPELLNKVKKLDIEYFDYTKEAGGLILGFRDNFNKFEIVRFIQLRNASKEKALYKLPNVFEVFLRLFLTMKIAELLKGITVIGEWHSDYYNKLGFSKQDMIVILKRCKRFGFWVAGVLVHKHRMTGKMGLKVFKYNKVTISQLGQKILSHEVNNT